MNLWLAILWTISLVLNIVSCAQGNEPSWISYFCAAGLLPLVYWCEWVKEKLK